MGIAFRSEVPAGGSRVRRAAIAGFVNVKPMHARGESGDPTPDAHTVTGLGELQTAFDVTAAGRRELGEGFTGQGHMRHAVSLAADFAFGDLRLHRLEAACLPNNEPSIRVLRWNGFQEEGLARSYLKINGEWRDHVLFALLADDPRPNGPGGG